MSPTFDWRLWARVALVGVLFLPTPVLAAFPDTARWFTHPLIGVPAVIWAVSLYMILFMGLVMAFVDFAASREG